MKNIILIAPPNVLHPNIIGTQTTVPPLNLAYLAAGLFKAGYSPLVIDALGEALDQHFPIENGTLAVNGLNDIQIFDLIKAPPLFFGISCMFSDDWIYIKQIIQGLKKRFPSTPIVLGGEHATSEAFYILDTVPEVDTCCLGEGDETIVQLAQHYQRKYSSLSDISGLAIRDSGKIIYTKPRKRMQNLDLLPIPSWESIPISKYHKMGFGFGRYGVKSMPITASRGCPYRCTFCSNEQIWGGSWRIRSTDSVIQELKLYSEKWGVQHIDFCDSTLVIDSKWILDFCNKIIKENLVFTFSIPSGTRSEALTDEVLKAMKQAGFNRIQYAPESASTTTLLRMRKCVDVNLMIKSARASIKLGIITKMTLIFGLPSQTLWEVAINFIFIFKMAFFGLHDLACFTFNPYPGSELYSELKEADALFVRGPMTYELFWANTSYAKATDMTSYSKHIPHLLMPFLVFGGMASFYFMQFLLRPHRLMFCIRNLIHGQPITMFENTLVTMYRVFIKRIRSIPR